MNLEHLRTPNPLNEFDYAAVRARVHSKLAQRRRWWMVFRFASAFAAVALAMLALLPSEPVIVPVAVPRAALNHGAAGLVRRAGVPPAPGGRAGRPLSSTKPAAPQQIAVTRPARRHKARTTVPTEVARIEIHTADPDIRIIWIVPKENS